MNETKKMEAKSEIKVKAEEFPSLSSSSNSHNLSTSGPSWSSLLSKKSEEDNTKNKNAIIKNDTAIPATARFSQFGQVENWQRESPKMTNTKIVDISNYQKKVREYKQNRPRQRHAPQIILSNRDEEEIIELQNELLESEYWDKKYAIEVPVEEDESVEEDELQPSNPVILQEEENE
jgi:hypothetical protein